eukprot:CAMPEP_0114580420 /NCGR_PEP_ID=MMETSP0125-20121206/4714_1 /TAXON_ID=485358 ORGANISM="Aristerostoma sp., Strain ATCC 50986" /NCGR_SAMPLE_ID=MMETSP0125 /ASSEMBLY_ACC=CAM_ASM_000245 /LENGTH=656 /DNA_ID=CAMNT_0001771981 /DNA_START=50 /DNA_END=2021 /DNA_ORIENTATION=-
MTATLVNDLSGNNFSGWKSLRTWSPQPLTTTSCSGGTCLKIENKKDSVESSGFKNYQISGSSQILRSHLIFNILELPAGSSNLTSRSLSMDKSDFKGILPPTNPYTVKFSMPFFCKVSELDVQIWGSNFGIRNLVIKGGNRCSGSCTCCLPEKLGSGCQDSATPLFTDLISSFNGWSDRRGNKVNTYTCQGNTILGPMGKDIAAHGTHFSKQYKLSRDVTGIAVSFEFNRVDSWDGESFYFYVNGKTVIQRAVQHQLELHGNTCTSGWNDEPIRLSFIIDLGTNVQDLLFSVSATLDQNAVDESYGLRDIKVYGWNECPSGAAKCIVEDHLLVTVECKPGASGCVEDTPDVKDLVTSFSGWTNTLTGSSMHTTTCTTGETILNGVGTTHDVHATKTFTLSKPHQYFVVYYKFYAVDSWDQEYFLALINNQYFSAVSTYWDMTTGNTCGNSYWPDKVFDIYEEVDLPNLQASSKSNFNPHLISTVSMNHGASEISIFGAAFAIIDIARHAQAPPSALNANGLLMSIQMGHARPIAPHLIIGLTKVVIPSNADLLGVITEVNITIKMPTNAQIALLQILLHLDNQMTVIRSVATPMNTSTKTRNLAKIAQTSKSLVNLPMAVFLVTMASRTITSILPKINVPNAPNPINTTMVLLRIA